MKKKTPKYKVDDIVKTKFGNGKIEKVDRLFKVVNEFDGLVTCESTIDSCKLPYRFDGETLEVDYPECDYGSIIVKAKTTTAKFFCYAYSVRIESNSYFVLLSESQVKKVKP